MKRLDRLNDELLLAEALVYFVFIGTIAVIAAMVAHFG